jgi:hypothetical protein
MIMSTMLRRGRLTIRDLIYLSTCLLAFFQIVWEQHTCSILGPIVGLAQIQDHFLWYTPHYFYHVEDCPDIPTLKGLAKAFKNTLKLCWELVKTLAEAFCGID